MIIKNIKCKQTENSRTAIGSKLLYVT